MPCESALCGFAGHLFSAFQVILPVRNNICKVFILENKKEIMILQDAENLLLQMGITDIIKLCKGH